MGAVRARSSWQASSQACCGNSTWGQGLPLAAQRRLGATGPHGYSVQPELSAALPGRARRPLRLEPDGSAARTSSQPEGLSVVAFGSATPGRSDLSSCHLRGPTPQRHWKLDRVPRPSWRNCDHTLWHGGCPCQITRGKVDLIPGLRAERPTEPSRQLCTPHGDDRQLPHATPFPAPALSA
jgi:hypothetical protein